MEGSNGGIAPYMKDERRTGLSLAERLNAIRAELPGVSKSGVNEEFGYRYQKEEDVLAAVRPLEIKWGVMVLFSATSSRQEHHGRATKRSVPMLTTTVAFDVLILNVDDPTDRLEVHWQGEAEDHSDKGTYQAFTSATRTFRQKLYSIPAGDEVEGQDRAGVQASSAGPSRAPDAAWRERPVSDKQRAFVTNLMASHLLTDKEKHGINRRLADPKLATAGMASDAIEWMKNTIAERKKAEEEAASEQTALPVEGAAAPAAEAVPASEPDELEPCPSCGKRAMQYDAEGIGTCVECGAIDDLPF